MSEGQAMAFHNGRSPEQDDAIDDIQIEIVSLCSRIEALGKHRSCALAVTKLEEAMHWLRDRKNKPA
jgi:hypothetical protein